MFSKSVILAALVVVLGLPLAGRAQADPDLIGWWRLNEGQGNAVADLSRYGNAGTFVGAPKWVSGKIGNALKFDGVDDYVRCAERVGTGPGTYPAELMPATFTVACWTRLNKFAYFSSFVGNGMDTGSDECGFFLYNFGWVDESGKDFGLAIRTEAGMSYVETPNIYETNTWYHVAATYDGKNVSIYINGALVAGPTDVGGPLRWISDTSGNYPERFAIGVWLDPGYDLWVDGTIDDVRYYSRALKTDEIKAVMTDVGYYPFAYGPVPKQGALIGTTSQTLQWSPGDSAVSHEVYFGDSIEKVSAAAPSDTEVFAGRLTARALRVGATGGPVPKGLIPGKTYYWRVDEVNDANPASPWKGNVWSFQVLPLTAWKPYPPDGMKYVDPNQDLSWEKGAGATFYTLYLGRTFEEINTAAKGGEMCPTPSFDPGALETDTTYYWRVDEFAVPANKTYKGPVWSFTTRGTGGGVKAQYFNGKNLSGTPVLTRTEDSIDHAWSGEIVAGLSDNVSARWTANLEAPFTETYSLITTSDDGVRLWLDGRLIADHWTDHATASDIAKVALVAGQVYSVRMEWYESEGDAVVRLSWESPSLPRQIIGPGWLQLPVKATSPYPANTAADVPQALTLRWAAGDRAAEHEIYFGEDKDAVTAATGPAATQGPGQTTYDPGTLDWGKTYYWRVDEVNAAETDSPWKGNVWSFATAGFFVVDDFEIYTDEVGERIFQTWLDGFGYTEPAVVAGNGTGATVGYLQAPFAEVKIVHGGYQAMPMDYNNVNPPYYSEAERTWTAPQNWMVQGVNTLVLYVRGESTNGAGRLYVAIQDSAGHTGVVSHADPAAVTSTSWLEWRISLGSFTGVNAAAIKKMSIGVGNRAAPTQGGAGSLTIDDVRVMKL